VLYGAEMWIWRRIEKISWIQKMPNKEVINRIGEIRTILETIKKRKKWLGHLLRKHFILRNAIVNSSKL